MSESKGCPFCGSETVLIKSPTLSLKRSGEYEPDMTPCCKAQAKNMQYSRLHKNSDGSAVTDVEDYDR